MKKICKQLNTTKDYVGEPSRSLKCAFREKLRLERKSIMCFFFLMLDNKKITCEFEIFMTEFHWPVKT